ncbi:MULTISPECIES: Trp family transcriptional regulator [Spongiibacter]|uniref:Trp family transcriptional regulator n=1 Tax=Spongiibacter TaxID=630749 RepID=UPI0003B2FF2A|nr:MULTISPECIES: Trp family transcriptional regulator [Spongiibacter]|tara:strand:+ start:447 stop:713 length:267 start_codon:yes stop_codon:yes gene_type:complete
MNTSRNTMDKHYQRELIEHLLTARDPDSLEQLLSDLLTPSELLEISKRLQIFKLLAAGLPQRQIAEQLGVGIATVTRGSRALKQHSPE